LEDAEKIMEPYGREGPKFVEKVFLFRCEECLCGFFVDPGYHPDACRITRISCPGNAPIKTIDRIFQLLDKKKNFQMT